MANVLGELFSDIANAIREKTGETDTKMKPIDFPEKIRAIESDSQIVDGVDPYYQKLAEALMKRSAEYLSGKAKTMSMKGFVVSDGSTLASLQPYSFAGFSNVESMEFTDVIMVQENAFTGNSKLKILDITVAKAITMASFYPNSLTGCTALEAIIIRNGEAGLSSALVNSSNGANDTFYIYVPAAYYDTVISNITDGFLPASRYRKLEDYPEIDNWNKTYTVKFYDGDTLLNTQTVPYGTVLSYTPKKDGYTFGGWEPETVAVTSNASYSAKWLPTFADATWQEVIDIANSGRMADYYSVGEEKTAILSYADGTTEEVTFQIAGFGVCKLYDGTSAPAKTDNVTLVLKNALATKQYVHNTINSGYYESTQLANLLNNTVYSALPDALRNGVKPIACGYGFGAGYSHKCWALDGTEVGLSVSGSDSKATQFPIFTDATSRIKCLGDTGVATDWWLRSCRQSSNMYSFGVVKADGTASSQYCNSAKLGVVFGFCI